MTSMQHPPRRRRVIVGVDTHKYVHVAVAIDDIGAVIEARSFSADSYGYEQLLDWAVTLGTKLTFAIEGTGSYGAGLTSAVRRRAIGVVEVMRTDRRDRRLRGKSDTLDAENAARAVLAGHATAVPKAADGTVEMLRQVKVAKDVAVKARTSAMISLKSVIINAVPELREQLQPLTKMALINRCAGLRPGPVTTVEAATKHTLRAIARRWQQLDAEIKTHEKILAELTAALAPDLCAAFAVGPDTAAEKLIVAGDNPERVRSEPAFAKLCGVAPIPASSGITTRHRLNRGGHRQANAALYRVVIVRMQHHRPTKAYVARRTLEGRTKSEIIRCLKRLLARELWTAMRPLRTTATRVRRPLDRYRSINAAAESTIGLYKNEAVAAGSPFRTGPLRTLSEVETLTMNYVHWYDNERLHSQLGNVTPEEYEQAYYASTTGSPSGDAANKKTA